MCSSIMSETYVDAPVRPGVSTYDTPLSEHGARNDPLGYDQKGKRTKSVVAHIRQGCRRIISEEEITEVFKELKDCKRCRNSIKYDKNRGSAVLGSGAFGTVFRARLGVKPVALKVMKATEMNYLQQKNRFVRELIALHLFLAGKENGLKHPNVLEFLGWSIKTKPDAKVGYGMTLILPLAPEGSLGYKLFENPVLEEGEVIRCALHVLRALKFLHSHRILHRDLKPENVLLFKEGGGRVYKLCDFGVAAVHTHTTQGTAVGTLPYMAPELRTKEKYNEAVDMYSFGVMLWELVSGAGPRKWPNFDNIEAKRANKYPPWDIVNKCRKEGEIFQKLKRLAQTYCKFKPTERENESRQDVIAKFEQWLREIKQPIKKKDLPFSKVSSGSPSVLRCKAKYISGQRKGQPCVNPAKYNGFCGHHKDKSK